MNLPKTLIYALGNPAREDDGLGFEFIQRLKRSSCYDRKYNFHLNIEDAELISKYKKVYFVDAAQNLDQAYKVEKVKPDLDFAFTTHGLSCGALLALENEIYGKSPDCYLISISGSSFQLKNELTKAAKNHLNSSLNELQKIMPEI